MSAKVNVVISGPREGSAIFVFDLRHSSAPVVESLLGASFVQCGLRVASAHSDSRTDGAYVFGIV